jgi:hypothetical protein
VVSDDSKATNQLPRAVKGRKKAAGAMAELGNYYRWSLYLARARGFGAEFWRSLDQHPGPSVVAREGDDDLSNATFFLTHMLVADMIDAAGAVESAVSDLELLLNEGQAIADGVFTDLDPENWPEFGVDFDDPSIRKARWRFADLIAGTRSLLDRLDRRGGTGGPRLGLVAQLAESHPIKAEVEAAFERLKGRLPDQRYLANYLLHASAVPYPFAPASVRRDATIVLKLPDLLEEPAWSMHDFTFEQERDAATMAHEILDAVIEFMDPVLERFAYWQENRFTPA